MVKNNAFLIFINMKLVSERLCSLKEERKEVRYGETHLYISGGDAHLRFSSSHFVDFTFSMVNE